MDAVPLVRCGPVPDRRDQWDCQTITESGAYIPDSSRRSRHS